MTNLTKTLLALCWVLFVAHVAMVLWAWPMLPESLPYHFGPSGSPDDWREKGFVTLGMIPLIHAGLLLLFTLLIPHPEWSNLPSKKRFKELGPVTQRRVAWVLQGMLASIAGLLSITFSVLSFSVVRIGLGQADALPPAFMVVSALMVVVILIGILAIRRCIPQEGMPLPPGDRREESDDR